MDRNSYGIFRILRLYRKKCGMLEVKVNHGENFIHVITKMSGSVQLVRKIDP